MPISARYPLDELMNAAEKVEKGIPLSPDLDRALIHGTSIGGAIIDGGYDTNDINVNALPISHCA